MWCCNLYCRCDDEESLMDPSVIGSTVTLMAQPAGCDESLQGINNIPSPVNYLWSFCTCAICGPCMYPACILQYMCTTNPTTLSQILSPLVSLLPPGLPPRTFACTFSSELLGFWFLFFSLFFVSGPCARLSWPSRQLLSARKSTVSYRIVSYRIVSYPVLPSVTYEAFDVFLCRTFICWAEIWYY